VSLPGRVDARVAAPPREPLLRWLARRWPIDAVSALTVFLIVSVCIPSPLIVSPIGASGTPGNLLGLVFLAWWALAKLGARQGVDRRPQPVRVALLCFLIPVLASVVAMYARTATGKETSGALRGLLYYGSLVGIALLAADGLTSIERIHTLMRRVVHGVAFVALIGLVEFLTGYNPAARLSIPGLVRNHDIESQGRSLFIRIQSTTLHPIELGSLLGITLPIALHYAFTAKSKRRKRVAWIEVLLIAAVLPMALSRTGIIAALVGLIVISTEWTWARRAKLLGVALVFLAAMRAAIPGLLGTMLALFTDVSQDNSTVARVQRYQVAGHYFLQNPWFGRGFNTLYPAVHQVFDNSWLYQATEQGILGVVGLGLFFLILMFTARGARRRSGDDLETRGLAQGLFGTFLAMAIMFTTADMGAFTILMGIFFLEAGVAGALWRLTGGARLPSSRAPAATIA
jgi:hypothetical protein